MFMDALGGIVYQEGLVFVFYPQAGGEVCIVYTPAGELVEEELVEDA
jgi:hypothetical protein